MPCRIQDGIISHFLNSTKLAWSIYPKYELDLLRMETKKQTTYSSLFSPNQSPNLSELYNAWLCNGVMHHHMISLASSWSHQGSHEIINDIMDHHGIIMDHQGCHGVIMDHHRNIMGLSGVITESTWSHHGVIRDHQELIMESSYDHHKIIRRSSGIITDDEKSSRIIRRSS